MTAKAKQAGKTTTKITTKKKTFLSPSKRPPPEPSTTDLSEMTLSTLCQVGKGLRVYLVQCEWEDPHDGYGLDGKAILGVYAYRTLANEAVLSYFEQHHFSGKDVPKSFKGFSEKDLKKPLRDLTMGEEGDWGEGRRVRVWVEEHRIENSVGKLKSCI